MDEKYHIAKKYLIPKILESHGVKVNQIKFEEDAVMKIIESYTREAGVRNLERELSSVVRKIGRKIAEGDKTKQFIIGVDDVEKILGPVKFLPELAEIEDMVGLSTGLSWSESGGDILFIEVNLMPGKGQVVLTGQLGDVMKESAQAAMSYVRANYAKLGLSEKFFQKLDVHVHVPEGAIPKDGPSAGIAMTTAIVSAFTKIPVRKMVAMTGEVTLRGRVLPIGGLKEKIIAAHRAGVKTVILPELNRKDMEDIPAFVRDSLEFVFVKMVDDVLKVALVRPPMPVGGKGQFSAPPAFA
jgi:ATP-dependent Lon protease